MNLRDSDIVHIFAGGSEVTAKDGMTVDGNENDWKLSVFFIICACKCLQE